jgi:hypothetical protein
MGPENTSTRCSDLFRVFFLLEQWNRVAEEILSEPWCIRELNDAFNRVICQRQVPLKLCLLVDGLDEFDGEHEQLCNLFKEVSSSNPNNTKFCLSSRPWLEFQDNFQGSASLRLQDLTFDDISLYVTDKFHRNPAFTRLEAPDSELASELVGEIVEKADGVFLWVKIVVRLLLRGMHNRDSMSQLWMRLTSFPRELDPLYETILSQIEPIYLEWASKAFQIMRLSHQLSSDPFQKSSSPVNSSVGKNIGEAGPRPLTIIGLFFAIEEDLDLSAVEAMSPSELNIKCEDTEVHLTARCAGLLEVSTSRGPTKAHPRSQIRYMHRTARDFLEHETHWRKILSDVNERVFTPSFAMMKSSISHSQWLPTTILSTKLMMRNSIHAISAMLRKL